MKKVLLCLFLILFSFPAIAGTPELPEYVEGEVLISITAPAFDDYNDMSAYSLALMQQADAFAKKYGLEIIGNVRSAIARTSGVSIICLRSEYKSTEELIMELSSDPDVISVQPNGIVSSGPPVGPEGPQTPKDSGCNIGYGSILFLIAALISLVKKK